MLWRPGVSQLDIIIIIIYLFFESFPCNPALNNNTSLRVSKSPQTSRTLASILVGFLVLLGSGCSLTYEVHNFPDFFRMDTFFDSTHMKL